MTRTVIINGRAYPVEFARVALEIEIGDGAFADRLKALREFMAEPPRTDVQTAVREAIEAARSLEPPPRNRRERRKAAALRRRGVIL